MPRCSIIIPVLNKASLTRQCLNTLLKQRQVAESSEIIVVDDASTDLTSRVLPEFGDSVRVLTQRSNKGFSGSCNDGAQAAAGDYLIFLNFDTVPQEGWLEALERYADHHPKAAAVGCKLLFPNHTVQHAGVVICQDRNPRHIYAGFPGDHPAVNKSRQFQVVTGACLLIRRDLFIQVGGFDTAFVNGYEDVDLCLRLRQLGHEIHYCHESVLYHLESVSDKRWDKVEHNTKLFRDRWGDHLRPDDLQYYIDDGLLTVEYSPTYPLKLAVAPSLAVVDGDPYQHQAATLIHARSNQVMELLKDNVRLNVRAMEAELRAAASLSNGEFRPEILNPAPVLAEPKILSQGKVHWRSNEPNGQLISLILPVKNGAAQLAKLVPMLMRQVTDAQIEIVAVDSGSTDDSVDHLQCAGATIIAIDPRSFNHGSARALAARHARGQVLVFFGQNMMPADDRWLANLVAPLAKDVLLAGVCSRVLPFPDADPLSCKDSKMDPSSSAERSTRSISNWEEYRTLGHHQLRLLINFHTVGAAIRADIFGKFPFREVTTIGEDIQWAKDVLEAGFKIQHEPSSVVYHGHHFTHLQTLQRNVDDGIANREIVGRRFDEGEILPAIDFMVRDDWRYLEKQEYLAADDRDRWRLESVYRRTAQFVGQWIGVNHDRMPGNLARFLSGVHQAKSGCPLLTPK